MAWLFLSLTLPPTLFIGVLVMKLQSQAQLDHDRKTYVLTFPQDLSEDRVQAWLRAVSGTLHARQSLLDGIPTIVFETWSSAAGIEHRIKVPWQHADDIMSQLRTHLRGLRYEPASTFPRHEWTYAVEIGESNPERSLRMINANDTAASILTSIGQLKNDEALVMQWVVAPSRPQRLPEDGARTAAFSFRSLLGIPEASKDELADRRKKLSEPNFHAVLRVAAKAETRPRAEKMVGNVRSSFTALNAPDNRFIEMRVTKSKLQERIDRAATSLNLPMTLAISELIPLIAYPIGGPMVAGLPRSASRHLPAPASVALEGLSIGRSNFPGNERPLALEWADITKHIHLTAPTDSGKTTTLANFGKQVAEQGMGMMVLEVKDDLFDAMLDYIPSDRIDDVIILNVHDTATPVGYNLLSGSDPGRVIDEIEKTMLHIYGSGSDVWLKKMMFHGLKTLMTRPGMTIADLPALLSPNHSEVAWRDELIQELKDQDLIEFWKNFKKKSEEKREQQVQPVLDRFWHFNSRPELRNVFGQSNSTFSMREAVANNKIVLVNLTNVEATSAMFIASMLVGDLWKAVRSNKPDKPFVLFADEVQDIVRMPIKLDQMLAQARSYNLSIIMANQSVSQLPDEVIAAAQNNARTKIVYQLEHDDAVKTAKMFGSGVTPSDLMNLAKHEGYARLYTPTGVSAPLSLVANPPADSTGNRWKVLQKSRDTYGRDVLEIGQQIKQRRTARKTDPAKRPEIGIKPWGKN
jgi:hypothetical protein